METPDAYKARALAERRAIEDAVAARIRAFREAIPGETQQTIATAIGAAVGTVRGWEGSGLEHNRRLPFAAAVQLARRWGITLDELAGVAPPTDPELRRRGLELLARLGEPAPPGDATPERS